MEIAMNILACGLVLSILGMIGGVVMIVLASKSIVASGRRANMRLRAPIDAMKEITHAAEGALLINVAHVSNIVADRRSAAQAVSHAAREIVLASAELGVAIGAAKEEVDSLVDGGGIEALGFAKDLIYLAMQMRGL